MLVSLLLLLSSKKIRGRHEKIEKRCATLRIEIIFMIKDMDPTTTFL